MFALLIRNTIIKLIFDYIVKPVIYVIITPGHYTIEQIFYSYIHVVGENNKVEENFCRCLFPRI